MLKNKFVLKNNSTLEDAISLMDIGGNGVLGVVDDQDVLLGLITDGDIRRAILNKSLTLESVINKNPLTMSYKANKKQIKSKLNLVSKKQMPLVDEFGKLVDIFILDDMEFNSKPNSIFIMAGGLGTRLGDLTKHTPKPMLKVGKKPILENLINLFSEYGFHNFYISVNYKLEVIKDYFKDGSDWGVKISYIEENKRMGTAGSLSLLRDNIEHPFFVINADILTTLNFQDLLDAHISQNSVATMCVRKYNYQIPYGVIGLKDKTIVSIEEKPSHAFHINAGIYIMNPDIIDMIPKDTFFDMPDLFRILIDKKINTTSYEIDDYWIDIGQTKDYKQALQDFEF